MKALLYKDVCVLYKQLKILLIALLAFCFMPGLSASVFALVYVIMLPITTLSYDERSKWNLMAAMMPYTTRQLVLSKYLLGYIGTVAVMALTFLSRLVVGDPMSDSLFSLLLTPCFGGLILAVLLPLMFRLGTEKGRLVYILTVGLLGGLSAGLEPGDLPVLTVSPAVLVAAAYILVVLVSALSIRLSIHICEKKKV